MNILNSQETYYSLLGVEQNASQDEIKRAYRKLSLELHPDRNIGDTEKSEKYKKITSAYNILSNSTERANYDSTLSFSNFGSPESMFMNMLFNPIDINNILNELKTNKFSRDKFNQFHQFHFGPEILSGMPFNNFPNGINNFEFDSKPKVISKTVNISFLDSYKGCKMPITLERWIYQNNQQITQEETLYIDIPKGIDNNEIITIKDKGNRLSSQNRGDVEVKINILNDTKFERNGIDLIYKKTLTLKESLCGFKFDLEYLDRREFQINNQIGNIIPPDFRKIIPKFGMMRDDQVGDLIIIFDIKYPKKLTSEQLEKLESIL
tara:strand:- start:567 stop:1532 length:966 start_codon:yes stop_codon:yes gene_type:complete